MSTATRRTPYQATFAVLAAGVGAYALLQSLVTPVLPTIQTALHTSQNTVTWVLTAYLLSASIFTPVLGRVGDMIGKERMFVACLIALAVGSLIAALATSIGVMILARVIQGVGGGVLPLAFGIVRDEFPREKVAGAVGIIAGLTAVGGGVGIVLAGPIVDSLDYHWLFWLPMIIVAISAVAAHFVLPQSPTRTPGRVSWLAAVLMSGWLVALLVAVSQAPVWGWGSLSVVGLLAASVVLAVVWVAVESRSPNPLIDMRMMRIPAVWTTNLVSLLFGVGLYATFAFLPEFLQTPKSTGYGFGASITVSGLTLLPMSVAMFGLSLVAGPLARRLGSKTVLVVGSAISALSFLILTVAHGNTGEILLAMAVLGVGFGMAFAAMSNLIVAAVPAAQTGVASGMNANIRTIGGSIGAAVMASIVTAGVRPGALPTESGYTDGFAMLGLATLAGAFAALLIPKLSREVVPDLPHAELALVASGTLSGDDPE